MPHISLIHIKTDLYLSIFLMFQSNVPSINKKSAFKDDANITNCWFIIVIFFFRLYVREVSKYAVPSIWTYNSGSGGP